MNASKRGHTPSSDDNDNKRTRDESPERLETLHTYNDTELEDVYTVNGIPEPRRAKSDCEDWDEPIILVVSRKTRDAFLKKLGNLTNETHETTTSQQRQKTTSHKTSDSDKTETIDKHTAQSVTDLYKDTTQILNNCTTQYSDEQLKKNLTPEQNLSKFREVCKALTHFRVSGVKTLNMIQQFKNGRTHSLINTDIRFVPNKLKQSTIDEIKHIISKSVTEANAMMFNKNLNILYHNIKNIQTLFRNTEPLIMAEAWRVVRRTIKHNLQFSFEPDTRYSTEMDKDTYRQPRPTDNDPRCRRMNRQTYQKPTHHNMYKRNTNHVKYVSKDSLMTIQEDTVPW